MIIDREDAVYVPPEKHMRPTCELRCVAMQGPVPVNVPYLCAQIAPGTGFWPYELQQKWISDDGCSEEWRPIPVVSP